MHTERRARLRTLVNKGLILLPGNVDSSMSYKANVYPCRQDSSFLYFFGLDRPGLVGILDIDKGEETLFGDDIDIEDLVWTGPVEALSSQAERVGIRKVRPLKDLRKVLDAARALGQPIHYLPPQRAEQ